MGTLLYQKVLSLFLQKRLTILQDCGLLLLDSDYVFDADHVDIGDIDRAAIIAEGYFDKISYSKQENAFLVDDITLRNANKKTDHPLVRRGTQFILYTVSEHVDACKLVANVVTGVEPIPVTDGTDLICSFPLGLLKLSSSGFVVPDIQVEPVPILGNFHEQIKADMAQTVFNTDQFGIDVIYSYKDGGKTVIPSNVTIKPDDLKIIDVDVETEIVALEIPLNVLKRYPAGGDKILYQGKNYILVTSRVFTYSIHIYIKDVRG